MAIVYSPGPIINNTFTATAITDITDNLKSNLVNAGWTVISGSSGDWTVESVATGQGLKHRHRIYNASGGTVSARITTKTSSGSLVSTSDMFLYPDATTWRVVCGPYSWFCMKDSSPSANKRDFACAGTLYIPSWLSTPTEAVFTSGHCLSDSSNSAVRSFRTALTNDGTNSNTGAYTTMYNGTMFNASTFESDKGTLRFRCGASGKVQATDITNKSCSTFVDGTYFTETPFVCWGVSGSSSAATANGVLYDALIVEKAYSYGTTKTFDSHSWIAITHSNIADSTNGLIEGTLFVRTS